MVHSCSNANMPKIGMFAVTPWDVVRGRPETRRQAAREKKERHPVQLVISSCNISWLRFLPPFHFPHSERMQRQQRISGTLKGLGKKKFLFRTLWEMESVRTSCGVQIGPQNLTISNISVRVLDSAGIAEINMDFPVEQWQDVLGGDFFGSDGIAPDLEWCTESPVLQAWTFDGKCHAENLQQDPSSTQHLHRTL